MRIVISLVCFIYIAFREIIAFPTALIVPSVWLTLNLRLSISAPCTRLLCSIALTTKYISSNLDSNPSNLDSNPSNLDSNPSNLDSNPSNLDSNPSNLDSNPSNLDSNLSNLDSNPSNLDSNLSNLDSNPSILLRISPSISLISFSITSPPYPL